MVKDKSKSGKDGKSAGKPVRNRAERPPDAPARILAAARGEFVAKGFGGARMQTIARAASVNHALLHYYFGSKEKLYQAAVKEMVSTIWSSVQGAFQEVPAGASFQQLLASLLKGHARVVARHPEFLLFLLRDMQDGRGVPAGLAEVFRSYGDIPRRVAAAYAGEVAAGRLRPLAPLHFWLNLLGMAVSGFLASQVLKHVETSPIPRVRFTEAFFMERAEVVAATVVNSLRPERELG
jgi:AcrR family transcriptional regulator